MPGTITQRNVFEAADSTYLDGVFGGRPLKIHLLPAVMHLQSVKPDVNGKEGIWRAPPKNTPAAGSYALSERETSCKR